MRAWKRFCAFSIEIVHLSSHILHLDPENEQELIEAIQEITHKELDSKTFRDFYFLKEELVKFCKENGLPVSGGKIDITDRIAHYLDTGETLSAPREKRVKAPISDIYMDAKIEPDFV